MSGVIMAWETDPSRIRQDRRLAVTLPVELPSGHGLPRDVSASGVFFETTHALSPGAAIRFSLLLEHADPMGPIRPPASRRRSCAWSLSAEGSAWPSPSIGIASI
jgi:hypothetical protein